MQRAIAESEALAAQSKTNRPDGAGYVNSKDLPRQSNAPPPSVAAPPPPPPSDKFVRALYQFIPSPVDPATVAPGVEELPFETGDIIRVLECVYNEWWRGELIWLVDEGSSAGGTPGREIGRKGIFPTVYVVRTLPLRSQRNALLTSSLASAGGDRFAQHSTAEIPFECVSRRSAITRPSSRRRTGIGASRRIRGDHDISLESGRPNALPSQRCCLRTAGKCSWDAGSGGVCGDSVSRWCVRDDAGGSGSFDRKLSRQTGCVSPCLLQLLSADMQRCIRSTVRSR